MKTLSKVFRFVPVAIVMGTIFFLSHQPGTELQYSLMPGFDKLAHALIYAVLAAAAIYALPARISQLRPVAAATWVVLFCLFYGISDEYHQSFIPGRDPSIGDIAADTAGSFLFILGWLRYITSGNAKGSQGITG